MKRLMQDIAASLYIIPATLEELMERDFLRNTSQYGVERMIMALENKDVLYYRGERMYIRTSYATGREMEDYCLQPKPRKPRRKTAKEAIREWNQKPG